MSNHPRSHSLYGGTGRRVTMTSQLIANSLSRNFRSFKVLTKDKFKNVNLVDPSLDGTLCNHRRKVSRTMIQRLNEAARTSLWGSLDRARSLGSSPGFRHLGSSQYTVRKCSWAPVHTNHRFPAQLFTLCPLVIGVTSGPSSQHFFHKGANF